LNLSSSLTWFLGIFTQEYRGHVTIWPVPSIKDYLNILSNFTDESIQQCIKKGQQRTFPKINMLKSILAIEKTFDSCYQEIKDTMQGRKIKNCTDDFKEPYQPEYILPEIMGNNEEVIVDAQ